MARMPLYKTAETEMIARIDRGDWEVGLRLPNEFVLADEFGVSQGTMRRALITLEGLGYLSRKPGRGTLVAARAPVDRATAAQRPGPAPETAPQRLLDPDGAPLVLEPFRARAGTRGATAAEAALFGSGRLATLERTLKWRGARAALDEVAVPEHVLPALAEDAPPDLAGHLSHRGVSVARITTEARAEVTDMAQSVALTVDRHTGLLCVTSTAFDARGVVLARQVLRLALKGAKLSDG